MIVVPSSYFSSQRREAFSAGLAASLQGSDVVLSETEHGDVRVTDRRGAASTISFDSNGFVSALTTHEGRRWSIRTARDGAERWVVAPSGDTTYIQYDEQGRVCAVGRDRGHLVRITYRDDGHSALINSPDGNARLIRWDANDRPVEFVDPSGAAETLRYSHDQLVEIVNKNSFATTFNYDGLTRPCSMTRPGGFQEFYLYDSAGLLSLIQSPRDITATIQRDTRGDIERVSFSDGYQFRLERDDAGKLIAAHTPSTSSHFSYDLSGLLVKDETNGMAVQIERDRDGTLTGIVYPSGRRVSYAWDGDLRLTEVIDWNNGRHSYAYFDRDTGHRRTVPSGAMATVRCNPSGLATSIHVATHHEGVAVPHLQLEVNYDHWNRVQTILDTQYGTQQFEYDCCDHLMKVTNVHGETIEEFSYDLNGNRIHNTSEPAIFGADDELLQQGNIQCMYDQDGNLIRMTNGEHSFEFSYNARNFLECAVGPQGSVVFEYDALGRRVCKRTSTRTIWYVWLGELCVGEYEQNADGVRVRELIFHPRTHEPIALGIDGEVYSIHNNHLGTPRLILDCQGRIAWRARYHAFGEATVEGSIECDLRLPGHRYDSETGLNYNRFRYYSPKLGRYVSRDPVSFLAGTNAYCYASNDPINTIDPTGLFEWPSWKTVAAGVGGAVAGVAAGAAIIAFAPEIAVGLGVSLAVVEVGALIGGGAIGGAVSGGLGEWLNHGFCVPCIAKAAGLGALVGAIASTPFLLMPASAGMLTVAGFGAVSGGVSYLLNLALTGGEFRWGDLALSAGLGAIASVGGKVIQGKIVEARATSSTSEASTASPSGGAPPRIPEGEFAPLGDGELPVPPLDEPPVPPPADNTFSTNSSRAILEGSEGAQGPGTNVGHAGDHIALNGEDPAALAEQPPSRIGRPPKPDNTTWRSPNQGVRDLRTALNANADAIEALPADGQTTHPIDIELPEQRQGFNSRNGGDATPVVFDRVTGRVCRMPDGRIHLVHFSPKL